MFSSKPYGIKRTINYYVWCQNHYGINCIYYRCICKNLCFLQEYHLFSSNIFIVNIRRKVSMGHLILQLCLIYMMSLLNSRTCSTLVSRQTIEYQQQLYSTSVLANFLFAYNLVMNGYLHYKPMILVLGKIYTSHNSVQKIL